MREIKSQCQRLVYCIPYVAEVSSRGHVVQLCHCSCLLWCCLALQRSCLSVNRTAFRPTTSSTLWVHCIGTPTASRPYDQRQLSSFYTWKAIVPSTPAPLGCITVHGIRCGLLSPICLSICWTQSWALQKWLSRSKCRGCCRLLEAQGGNTWACSDLAVDILNIICKEAGAMRPLATSAVATQFIQLSEMKQVPWFVDVTLGHTLMPSLPVFTCCYHCLPSRVLVTSGRGYVY